MEKTKARGIFIKKMSDGSEAYMVRFKYLGKTYPIKNFTKLFGCRTLADTKKKLVAVKIDIDDNKDPFKTIGDSLNDLFYERLELCVKNGIWEKGTTAKIYKEYYESIIKKPIGHKKLSKITYQDLKKIKESISYSKGSYQNRLKRILKPIFDEGITRGEIFKNIVEDLKTEKVEKKEKISNRSLDDNLTIVRKLYNTIPEYRAQYGYLREELRFFLYLTLLTSHRYGELLKLTKEDVYIEENMIVSQSDITKTDEIYKFPLPEECKEYFESIETGLLFPNLNYGSMYMIFQRLVQKSNIRLFRGKKITIHDTRTLMLNIMIKHCKIDSRLADYCLEHKQSDVIEHYLDYDYEDKVESFNKYWDLIRQKE